MAFAQFGQGKRVGLLSGSYSSVSSPAERPARGETNRADPKKPVELERQQPNCILKPNPNPNPSPNRDSHSDSLCCLEGKHENENENEKEDEGMGRGKMENPIGLNGIAA